MWVGVFVYMLIIAAYIACSYFELVPYYLQGSIVPVLYLNSTLFLADGLNRIRKVMKTLQDGVIMFRGFVLHLSAFCFSCLLV